MTAKSQLTGSSAYSKVRLHGVLDRIAIEGEMKGRSTTRRKTMKRMLLFWVLSFGFGLAGLPGGDSPALAGSGFSNRDLSGDYLFHLAEIRIEYDNSSGVPVPVTDYCDVAGTLSFDG
ncbi:MAG TPA: hypothetical protein VI702_03955, partial [Nitrospiria bacterium]